MASVDLSTSPWLIRVFDRVPLSLPVMGMLIALAYFLFVTLLAHADRFHATSAWKAQ